MGIDFNPPLHYLRDLRVIRVIRVLYTRTINKKTIGGIFVKKQAEVVNFIKSLLIDPAYQSCSKLSFHIARQFAAFPLADPEDYSDEIDLLCNKLGLDGEEMLI